METLDVLSLLTESLKMWGLWSRGFGVRVTRGITGVRRVQVYDAHTGWVGTPTEAAARLQAVTEKHAGRILKPAEFWKAFR